MTHRPSRGSTLAAAAVERQKDADVLLRNRRFHAAAYMAGYAVECSLKAALCRQAGMVLLEERLETHDLEILAGRTGGTGQGTPLWQSMRLEPEVAIAFDAIVAEWSVAMRYRTARGSKDTASRVLLATGTLIRWLNAMYE